VRLCQAVDARRKWKAIVAWSYLIVALVALPLFLEFLLEALGVIRPPIESALPEVVFIALVLDAFAVGGIIFLGWPFAIAIVWFLRHDRRFAAPAILFLVAEGLLATNLLVWPGSQAMFAVCVAFGGVFCIAAIRAWVLWIREPS
jgi:hypothetical protein